MEILIWIGAILSLLGIAGLAWCVMIALRAKRERLEGEEMKARLQRVVAINLAVLLLSALGLMMVAVGVILT